MIWNCSECKKGVYTCTYIIPHKTCAGSCDFCSCYIINSNNWTSTSAVNLNDMNKICITTTIQFPKLPNIHDILSANPSVMTEPAPQPLQSRQIECCGVLNLQPHDYLFNRLFGRRTKKTSKLRVTGLCAGNSPVTGEFPAQMASNAEMLAFDDIIMVLSKLSPKWRPPHYASLIRRWMNRYIGVIHKGHAITPS